MMKDVCLFNQGNARLFMGDTTEIMDSLPAESIDVIFADPPYGLSNGGTSCYAGKRVSVNKGNWDKSRGVEANFEFHTKWISACKRLLKPAGTLWVSGTHHSIYVCGFALQKDGWDILNEICWYKPNAAPHLACRMFAHSHETLIWARKSKSTKHYFNYELMTKRPWPEDYIKKQDKQMRSLWGIKPENDELSIWSINTPSKSEKKYGKHPTQKPLELLNRIILATSREGDMVLDPFCGSGTTGVAALKHHRRFIGIDNEVSYLHEYAIPRLQDILELVS